LLSGLKVSCVIPYLSLKLTKIIPPRSRTSETQPFKVTDFPISAGLSSPQVCVLFVKYIELQRYEELGRVSMKKHCFVIPAKAGIYLFVISLNWVRNLNSLIELCMIIENIVL